MEQEISSIQLVLTIPLLVFLGCAIVAMFQQGKTGLNYNYYPNLCLRDRKLYCICMGLDE